MTNPLYSTEETELLNLIKSNSVGLLKGLLPRIKQSLDTILTQEAPIEPILHRAARLNHEEVVRLLVAAGASVNQYNQNGETPLSVAITESKNDCLVLYLAKKSDPATFRLQNSEDNNNSITLLYLTIVYGHYKTFQYLTTNWESIVQNLLVDGASISLIDAIKKLFFLTLNTSQFSICQYLIEKNYYDLGNEPQLIQNYKSIFDYIHMLLLDENISTENASLIICYFLKRMSVKQRKQVLTLQKEQDCTILHTLIKLDSLNVDSVIAEHNILIKQMEEDQETLKTLARSLSHSLKKAEAFTKKYNNQQACLHAPIKNKLKQYIQQTQLLSQTHAQICTTVVEVSYAFNGEAKKISNAWICHKPSIFNQITLDLASYRKYVITYLEHCTELLTQIEAIPPEALCLTDNTKKIIGNLTSIIRKLNSIVSYNKQKIEDARQLSLENILKTAPENPTLFISNEAVGDAKSKKKKPKKKKSKSVKSNSPHNILLTQKENEFSSQLDNAIQKKSPEDLKQLLKEEACIYWLCSTETQSIYTLLDKTLTLSRNEHLHHILRVLIQNNAIQISESSGEIKKYLAQLPTTQYKKLCTTTASEQNQSVLIYLVQYGSDTLKIKKEEILHLLVEQGHLESIKKLLEKWPHLKNQTDSEGNTILHLATTLKHDTIVEWLIDKYAELINQRNQRNQTAIQLASEQGNRLIENQLVYKAILLAIQQKETIKLDSLSHSFKLLMPLKKELLLQEAINARCGKTADWLIQQGVKLTINPSPPWENELSIATYDQEAKRIKQWLKAIGIVNNTTLQANYRQHLNQHAEKIQKLHLTLLQEMGVSLEARVQVPAPTQRKKKPLQEAPALVYLLKPTEETPSIKHQWRQAFVNRDIKTLCKLIEHPNINWTERLDDGTQETVLHWAIAQKEKPLIKQLLKNRQRFHSLFNLRNALGQNAFEYARLKSTPAIITALFESLIEHQCDTAFQYYWKEFSHLLSDTQKETLFYHALQMPCKPILLLFIQHIYCDFTAKNAQGVPFLHRLIKDTSINENNVLSILEALATHAFLSQLLSLEHPINKAYNLAYASVKANRMKVTHWLTKKYPEYLVQRNHSGQILLDAVNPCNDTLQRALVKQTLHHIFKRFSEVLHWIETSSMHWQLSDMQPIRGLLAMLENSSIAQAIEILTPGTRNQLSTQAERSQCWAIIPLLHKHLIANQATSHVLPPASEDPSHKPRFF